MRKKGGLIFASIGLFVLFFSCQPCAAAEKIIKIGTLFPLTGSCALAGQRCQASVETAADVINNRYPDIQVPLAAQEGILNGYKIQLVHADHQGKPDVGKSEAERLYNQEGVYAIIGSYNSAVTKPASFVAERKKKLFMCGCSSSAALTQRGFKYFFRMAPTDQTESIEFVEVMHWLEKSENATFKTVGIIYENSEFGKHAADEGKKAAADGGYQVIADVAFSPGATNLNSEVQTLKAKNPDVVFGACLGGDYTLWVRTMKQMDWLPKAALNYCTGYQDPVITGQLGADANYFMGGTGYSPEFAELMPAVAAVEKIYTDRRPAPASPLTATASRRRWPCSCWPRPSSRPAPWMSTPLRKPFTPTCGILRCPWAARWPLPRRPEHPGQEPDHPAAGRFIQAHLSGRPGGHRCDFPDGVLAFQVVDLDADTCTGGPAIRSGVAGPLPPATIEAVTMTTFLQVILDGLMSGMLYALVAVGLGIIFGVMDVINFAHGEFLMVAMYVSYWLGFILHVDPLISVVAAGAFCSLWGGIDLPADHQTHHR
jgi:branched-chain amino acid transport system substrate-binding protein